MRTIARALGLSLCVSLMAATLAQTQNQYTISVSPDETTRGELEMVGHSLVTANDGEAPRSLRKLAAGAGGELAILAHKRIDSNEVLTLDDGTPVGLIAGDAITITQRCDNSQYECDRPGAQIEWDREGHGPILIVVRTGNGCIRGIDFGTQPPLIFTKCPIAPER